jgi:hypothetical protein
MSGPEIALKNFQSHFADLPPPYSLTVNSQPNLSTQTISLPHLSTTIIPEGKIIMPGGAPLLDRPSSIEPFIKFDGSTKCFDPALDNDPEEVFRFFMTHLNRPKQLLLQITGTREITYRTSDGVQKRTETDFSFKSKNLLKE